MTKLRDVPADATWPRLMTGPHPAAVGSFGAEAVRWLAVEAGLRLRWWQRLWLTRALEYDGAGELVWLDLLLSTARQVGKSVAVRGAAMWRLHQADRFGEEQLILHTARDLQVAREVQRPARTWAKDRAGYVVREANGKEEVTSPDGSRWLIRATTAVYGYGATLGVADEAWGIEAGVVEDGLEPTMAERCQPQLLLPSTAHRRATGLFLRRRAAALGTLTGPSTSLLMEWSAPVDAGLEDPSGWRAASPHWTDGRARLLMAKLERALAGVSDDPDEDDPVESFRSQFLNIWPARSAVASSGRDELWDDAGRWAGAADPTVGVPAGPMVLTVEDWYGTGGAAAGAGLLADGRVFVFGSLFGTRAAAAVWAGWQLETHPGSRLLATTVLATDPAVTALGVPVAPVSGAATRAALTQVRELLRNGRVVHDGGGELAEQVRGLRVARREGGLTITPRSGRCDLARAVMLAAADAVRTPVTPDFFVY